MRQNEYLLSKWLMKKSNEVCKTRSDCKYVSPDLRIHSMQNKYMVSNYKLRTNCVCVCMDWHIVSCSFFSPITSRWTMHLSKLSSYSFNQQFRSKIRLNVLCSMVFKPWSHRANGRVTDKKSVHPFISVLCSFLIR